MLGLASGRARGAQRDFTARAVENGTEEGHIVYDHFETVILRSAPVFNLGVAVVSGVLVEKTT